MEDRFMDAAELRELLLDRGCGCSDYFRLDQRIRRGPRGRRPAGAGASAHN